MNPTSRRAGALRLALALVLLGTTLLSWIWYRGQRQTARPGEPDSTRASVSPSAPGALPNDPLPERRLRMVDLSNQHNAALANAWHFPGGRGTATLRALPRGQQEFGGVPFDIQGIVQLASRRTGGLPQYPERITGIPVGARCRVLHFLHATGWVVPSGTTIASYWIRYADGTAIEFPIVYGDHLREWHGRSDRKMEIASGQLAWQDNNPHTKRRLFQCRWDNPNPNVEVAQVDFVSAMTDCFPFLIAVTAE